MSGAEMEEADWNKERDRLFFELLKKLFERQDGDGQLSDWRLFQ